jgi:glycosyltransferase involved in cell wall biosynthesis
MNSLRLCFVVESGTDVRLVEGLAERFDVELLARSIPGGSAVSHPPAAPITTRLGPASRFGFARYVARQLHSRRADYDVILVQGYGLAALTANFIGRLMAIPAVMLVCSPIEAYYQCRRTLPQPGKPFRWWELWMLQFLAFLNARIGRHYVALSRHLADVIRRQGGKPITIVPVYGVDTRVFTPTGESKQAIRDRLGLPVDGTLIFFSSRIAPEKDDDTLLKATRDLLAGGRDLWLLNCSGGHDALRRNAERWGIAHRVIARDAVHPHQQLPDYYRAADLCVQASRAEGLGFSPLEALACEVPVVAAHVGGLRETIRDGQTGWTYPVGDAAALAGCIRKILDAPAEAARRAASGRQLVIQTFERNRVLDDFAALLQQLVAPGRLAPV